MSVAAGPAHFLVKRIDIRRHLVMYDESDVGMVDAHAKGVRRHENADIPLTVGFLGERPVLARHSRVIKSDGGELAPERSRDFLGGATGAAINQDTPLRSLAERLRDPRLFVFLVRAGFHL